MKKKKLFAIGIISIITLIFSTCTKDKGELDYTSNGYPKEVEKIIINKCATSGCHNDISYMAAGGLNLSSWEKLFDGANNKNIPVIPYRTDLSFLLPFINTYSDLGSQLSPTMPVGKPPLSREEVITIRDWIASGAPNANDYVKFSDNPNRSKIYVSNQGCDLVAVFDAKTKSLMRYVNVGNSGAIEVPHSVVVSPDGQFWYADFVGIPYFQKHRCSDDTKVGELNLVDVGWHTMSISGDSKYAFAIHWDGNGKVALIDLTDFSVVQIYQGSGLFIYPHGSALNQNGSIGYVTASSGNFIYKINMADPNNPDITEVVLQPGDISSSSNDQFKPHQIGFSPDYSNYFVSCETTNEVRVFNSSNDSLIAIIPTCKIPEEMSFSTTTPYLFVTSFKDTSTFSPNTGCVTIINYQTKTFVKNIYTGFQPHQLRVDDADGYVFVANRNISMSGPAPHHVSSCTGRNGYATAIDLNTLELVPNFKVELSVDPYSVSIRN